MNQEDTVRTFWGEAPPLIGRCLKCRTEILASLAFPTCPGCNEPLPYGINMQRRPIMYGTIKVTPANLIATEGSQRTATRSSN